MLKKFLSFLTITSLILSLRAAAFAANETTFSTNQIATAAQAKNTLTKFQKNYAYRDYNSADAAAKKLILKARGQIIFGNIGWSVDGNGYIKNKNGSIIHIPKFSSLFPRWNLKQICDAMPMGTLTSINTQNFSTDSSVTAKPGFAGIVNIKSYSGSRAPEFYQFNAQSTSEAAWAYTLPGSTWNVGYRNMDTGDYILYYPNLQVDQHIVQPTNALVRYGVYCSCNPGAGKDKGQGFIYVQPQ